MSDRFAKVHDDGAERHGGLWLQANIAAVNAINSTGGRPEDPQTKLLAAAIVLRVLDVVKRETPVSETSSTIPEEFAHLAMFYDVKDMATLVRVQEERIEHMRQQLPKPRGPESDPQNYRRG